MYRRWLILVLATLWPLLGPAQPDPTTKSVTVNPTTHVLLFPTAEQFRNANDLAASSSYSGPTNASATAPLYLLLSGRSLTGYLDIPALGVLLGGSNINVRADGTLDVEIPEQASGGVTSVNGATGAVTVASVANLQAVGAVASGRVANVTSDVPWLSTTRDGSNVVVSTTLPGTPLVASNLNGYATEAYVDGAVDGGTVTNTLATNTVTFGTTFATVPAVSMTWRTVNQIAQPEALTISTSGFTYRIRTAGGVSAGGDGWVLDWVAARKQQGE